MSFDVIRRVVDTAAENKDMSDILFFGGEPLLEKNLIFQTVEYCKHVEKNSDCRFSFSLNTNGMLLDDEFLLFSVKNRIMTSISIDGIREAHDRNRIDLAGKGTFSRVSEKADLLLEAQPYAISLTLINPETVEFMSQSIEYLITKGFRYLLCSINYKANWDKESLRQLEKQYRLVSKIYYKRLERGMNIYFSPFDTAINTYINKKNLCKDRCELGMRQVAINPQGKIFPCIQFAGDEEFQIGDVYSGVDRNKQQQMYKQSSMENEACLKCALNQRCNNNCSCINKLSTGRIDKISPILCSHRQALIPIADRLAEKLYKKKVPMFIQKFYNDTLPLITNNANTSNKHI